MSDRGKIRALLLAVAVLVAIIAGLAYKFIVAGSTEKSADGRTAIVLAPALASCASQAPPISAPA